MFTSGIPPELLDITGTPEAMASKAASPKLSVSEGSMNTDRNSIKFGLFHGCCQRKPLCLQFPIGHIIVLLALFQALRQPSLTWQAFSFECCKTPLSHLECVLPVLKVADVSNDFFVFVCQQVSLTICKMRCMFCNINKVCNNVNVVFNIKQPQGVFF